MASALSTPAEVSSDAIIDESRIHQPQCTSVVGDITSDCNRRGMRPEGGTWAPRHGIWVLLVLLGLLKLAPRLLNLPLNRVIEARFCRAHYLQHDPSVIAPDGTIPEHRCKVDPVQQKLAWLQGVMETSIIFCGKLPLHHCSSRFSEKLPQTSLLRFRLATSRTNSVADSFSL